MADSSSSTAINDFYEYIKPASLNSTSSSQSPNILSTATTSATISTNSPATSSDRIIPCAYCSRRFTNFQALGGHQNAHKRERANASSRSVVNQLARRYPYQYNPDTHEMYTYQYVYLHDPVAGSFMGADVAREGATRMRSGNGEGDLDLSLHL